MKEIPLTKGQVALVDDEDYEYLMQWKWYAKKGQYTHYAGRSEKRHELGSNKRKIILMHRAILNTPINMDVDHKDHNGLNNQRYNIRTVTHAENMLNKIYHKERSKYLRRKHIKNVTCVKTRWDNTKGAYKNKGRYQAQIVINGKIKHLGMFSTYEDGHNAYLNAVRSLNK